MDNNIKKSLLTYGLGLTAVSQEYKQLRAGSLYWVGVSEQKEAIQLAGRTIEVAPAKARILLLADSHLDDMLSYIPIDATDPIEVRSYHLRGHSPVDMLALTKQLDRAAQPKARLILLVMPVAQAQEWAKKAALFLVEWRQWLQKNQSVMVVVSYGAESETLVNKLYLHNEALSGLSFLQKNELDELLYQVWHWRNQLGVSGQALFQLTAQGDRLVFTDTEPFPSSTSTPSTTFLQTTVANQLALTGRDDYVLVDSWDALVEKGITELNPTLVFVLQRHQDLEQLARTLYYLRQQRQQALRLVVLEMGPHALRHSEIELLTLSGCSLVIPKVNLSRFFNLLDVLHSQPDRFQVTGNLDQALQKVQAQSVRGELAIPDFVSYLEHVYSHFDGHEPRGSLVIMTPVDMLSTAQLLAQIQIQRDGDVVCATTKWVYVFLFECEAGLVNVALERLLRLPLSELVTHHNVVVQPSDVQRVVEQLKRAPVSEFIPKTKESLPLSAQRHVFHPVRQSLRHA